MPDIVHPVLHVITRFEGGSKRRLEDMIAAFPKYVHVVCVGESAKGLPERWPPGIEVRVVRFERLRRQLGLSDVAALVAVVLLIRRTRPVIIVAHQAKPQLLIRLASLLRLTRRPVVCQLSMSTADLYPSGVLRRVYLTLERVLALSPRTLYVAVGYDLARQVKELSNGRVRATVIRTSLELEAERAEVQRPADVVLGFMGSLDERKGVLRLPVIARLTSDLLPDHSVRLEVYGDGHLKDDLVRSGHRELGDRFVFGGTTSQPNIATLGFSCFVLLSESEGLPQVLIRCLAQGVPFVALDVTGVSEVVGLGGQGRVVPRDASDLRVAQAVAQAVTEPTAQPVDTAVIERWSSSRVAMEYVHLLAAHIPDPTL